uniref:MYND-type domain-containing protein n=1 Tax=Heterorhabditis bacteriophora TaxID=37862 RepID=A0A1I7X7N2_HETBA
MPDTAHGGKVPPAPPPPPPEKPRRTDARRRAMKKVDELHPPAEQIVGIGTNWLSGEERSRLEAVQRDWRQSRPYNATNRICNFFILYKNNDMFIILSAIRYYFYGRIQPWIRARQRELTQDVATSQNVECVSDAAYPVTIAYIANVQPSIFDRNRYIVLVTELMTSGTLKMYLKRFKRINIKISLLYLYLFYGIYVLDVFGTLSCLFTIKHISRYQLQHIPDEDTKMITKLIKDKQQKDAIAQAPVQQQPPPASSTSSIASHQLSISPPIENGHVQPGSSVSLPTSEEQTDSGSHQATHEEKKKAKRKIIIEILKVDESKDQPVSFVFSLAENCLAQHHVAIVEEQLDDVIRLVNDGPNKGVGMKLTTVVETQTTTSTSNALSSTSSLPQQVATTSSIPLATTTILAAQPVTTAQSSVIETPLSQPLQIQPITSGHPVVQRTESRVSLFNSFHKRIGCQLLLVLCQDNFVRFLEFVQVNSAMSRSVEGSMGGDHHPLPVATVPQSASVQGLNTTSVCTATAITVTTSSKPSRFQVTPSAVISVSPALPTTTISESHACSQLPPVTSVLSSGSSPSTTAHSNTSSVTSNASTGSRFKLFLHQVQAVPVQSTLAPTLSVESGFSSSTSTHTEASMASIAFAATPIAAQPNGPLLGSLIVQPGAPVPVSVSPAPPGIHTLQTSASSVTTQQASSHLDLSALQKLDSELRKVNQEQSEFYKRVTTFWSFFFLEISNGNRGEILYYHPLLIGIRVIFSFCLFITI